MTSPSHPAQLATALIGLGSNLGERTANLRSAIAALRQLGTVEAISAFYETAPVGMIDQPDFLNAVVELRTGLPPRKLLRALLNIELQHGRDRAVSVPKGPRTLDLDLLAYDDVVMNSASLTLPHPALAERHFVLMPLVEIAANWRHPILGKTAAELLAKLGSTDQEIRGEAGKTGPS